MDVADVVRREASLLPALALALIGLDRDATGLRTEKPAHDLGHATIRFSLALDDLAAAGEAAYVESNARFEPDQPRGDGLAGERAQLALLSAIGAGDFALDAFAWAELVRRERPPEREKSGKVPWLWRDLMAELDADPTDPMTASARFLDVTLDAARDALGAHRDPELEQMTGTGTGGIYSLELITLSDARIRLALRCLDRITVPFSPYLPVTVDRSAYRTKVEHFIAASSLLDSTARQNLRTAYRRAGIASPSLAAIAGRYRELVELYLSRRDLTAAT